MNQGSFPEFTSPPVQEVVLSAKFRPTGLTAGHVGLLWSSFRSDFPNIEEHPLVDAPVEARQQRVSSDGGPRIELLQVPRSRVWFLNSTGSQLLQVQHDFFAHNWRRRDVELNYPRYENIRKAFVEELSTFVRFLEQENLGAPEPVQCEITYVNHIAGDGAFRGHSEIDKVFRHWSKPKSAFLPGISDARFVARFDMPELDGEFGGRLYLSVQPGFRSSDPLNTEILVTTLTARGLPRGKGIDGVMAFLDLGHEWIVRGFVDATTESMHNTWGRTR